MKTKRLKPSAKPSNPLLTPRFSQVRTFNRLPWVPHSEIQKGEIDIAILGVPWDGGTTFRPGARLGPAAVREASVLSRNFNPVLETDVYESLRVVDGGDLSTNPLNPKKTYDLIETELLALFKKEVRTINIGGDHSILLPELRALHRKYGRIGLVQFDAHTDTADQAWGEKFHHGTPIRRAIEEGLIEGKHVFQIGIRGPLTSATQEDYVREQKISVLGMEDFHDSKTRNSFFDNLLKKLKDMPCFVSFDVDGVDPAFAPGTGTPVVGGLTSYEALTCLRKLRGLNVVGGDVVEIAPMYDHAQLTSLLGSQVLFEILSLMSLR